MEAYKFNMLQYLDLLIDKDAISNEMNDLTHKIHQLDMDCAASGRPSLFRLRHKHERDLMVSRYFQLQANENELTNQIFEISSQIVLPPNQQKRVTFLIPGTSQFGALYEAMEA